MEVARSRLSVFFNRMAITPLRAQLRRNWCLLVTGASIVVACALGVVGFARVTGVNPAHLMRDIYVVAGAPLYVGLVSNLGILGWCAAATVWMLNVYLMRQQQADPRYGLSVSAAGLTVLLLIDDGLMLHEALLPRLTGLDETVFLIGYVLLALVFARYALPRMLGTDYLLACIAAGFLAASYIMDFLLPFTPSHTLYEDLAKFGGIVFWLAYTLSVFRDLAIMQARRSL